MVFMLPANESESGQIKWGKDTTKCWYVHNGWQGNGNTLQLWPCKDLANYQGMNFTIFSKPWASAITWSKEPMRYPNKCVDVHNLPDAKHGGVELWDCSAGTMWKLEDSVVPTAKKTAKKTAKDQWTTVK